MKKGEIWLVKLPAANGHEQAGTRPVIILSETEANIAVVIPLTSNIQALRYPHTIEVKPSSINGLKTVSVVLVFQIRAIDKMRLNTKIGEIEEKVLTEADMMLRKMLRL